MEKNYAQPKIPALFASRKPSDIRVAQILFAQRPDAKEITALNLAIGNVSLPMHP